MKLVKKMVLQTIGLCIVGAYAAPSMAAEGFPSRPITLVAAQAAGGSLDSFARQIAQKLSNSLGQPVVVDNRVGAGGLVAEQAVARAEADGYTLLLDAAQIAVNASIHQQSSLDLAKDLVPVATLHTSAFMIAASPSLQSNSVSELVDFARQNPNKLNFAYTGNSTRIGVEAFRQAAAIDIQPVPYAGWANASLAMLRGDVEITIIDIASPLALVQAGKLRALAIAGPRRTPLLPNVPTTAEAGLPGAEAGTWYMIFAPAGTPADRIEKLNAEINQVVNEPEMLAWLKNQGAERLETTPEEAAQFYDDELKRMATAVRDANIPIQ